jgi:hypothetical protein
MRSQYLGLVERMVVSCSWMWCPMLILCSATADLSGCSLIGHAVPGLPAAPDVPAWLHRPITPCPHCSWNSLSSLPNRKWPFLGPLTPMLCQDHNVPWRSFSRPHTSILFSYWSYDLVHQFHPVQDWPIGTEFYPLFPIYTGLPTGKLRLPLACSLLYWTILRPWRWRRYVPPKLRVPLNPLHGVISQKKILFKTTAVKTSNPTF